MEKIIDYAKSVFDDEIESLNNVKENLDQGFIFLHNKIANLNGKLIFSAIGKPALIAKKASATFSSLCVPSFFIHPSDALHGDSGSIESKDLVIVLSFSGESSEVIKFVDCLKKNKIEVCCITGKENSTLSHICTYTETLKGIHESRLFGVVPSSSTTAFLVYLDALAISVAKERGFTMNDFSKHHPGGLLGKSLLLKVDDIMVKANDVPVCSEKTTVLEALTLMCGKPVGLINVLDNGKLIGIVTDGDIRRAIAKTSDIGKIKFADIINRNPQVVISGTSLPECLTFFVNKKLQCAPVTQNGKLKGVILLKDILHEGFSL